MIVFSANCFIGMVRGLLSVMVFDRVPSISFALRTVQEKRIQSQPFTFAQHVSVCEGKFQLISTI